MLREVLSFVEVVVEEDKNKKKIWSEIYEKTGQKQSLLNLDHLFTSWFVCHVMSCAFRMNE